MASGMMWLIGVGIIVYLLHGTQPGEAASSSASAQTTHGTLTNAKAIKDKLKSRVSLPKAASYTPSIAPQKNRPWSTRQNSIQDPVDIGSYFGTESNKIQVARQKLIAQKVPLKPEVVIGLKNPNRKTQ